MSVQVQQGLFEKVDTSYSFARMEEQILKLWDERRVFERSLEKPAPLGSWVFYEGPPTANNMPHPGHVLTRVAKDLLPRFKTMQGHYVRRQAGWDTHGLPVELSVEKELFEAGEMTERGPSAIVRYGVEKFNRKCFESVRRYEAEWVKLSSRLAYWLDYENAYFTFSNKYIESVWWLLKNIYEQGLLYKGYRIQWYSTLVGTGLSSHEVAQNWQVVKDPSATVRARVLSGQQIGGHSVSNGNTYFLLWTTTPWTLISNVALCVHPDYDYVVVRLENATEGREEFLVLAEALLAKNGLEAEQVVARVKGSELLGLNYEKLYDYALPDIRTDGAETSGWRVLNDTYVTLEDGTGVVHEAPAFGEDDYRIGLREKLPILNAIDAEGRVVPEAAIAAGKWFKEADPMVLADLKARGLLYKSEKHEHNYPHCYRTDAPLMQYPLESWFIRMSAPEVKSKLIAGNEQITWQPAHIKQGRFGDWLREVKDWSLSRDRFWGTPLPVWDCEACGHQECLGSYEELKARCPERFAGVTDLYDQEQFNPHRPFIDDYTWACPQCSGGTMKRVRFVIDCWFDAGSMPFAQLHYPFENKDLIDGPVGASLDSPAAAAEEGGSRPATTNRYRQFPANFISEAIDQTRGWFYTQHAISTLIKGEPCFKSCLVLGHILDEKGRKMSKRLGNVVDPWGVIDKYGADAFRWYFYSSGSLTSGARFSDKGVLETLQRFIIPLWNVYSFFTIYANLDGFDPRTGLTTGAAPHGGGAQQAGRPAGALRWEELSELDKWIRLKFNRLCAESAAHLERLELPEAARAIEDFVDELSNWYVRRSRRRFWSSEHDSAKLGAYQTLYFVLVELSKLLAPYTPFLAEELYQKLALRFVGASLDSPGTSAAEGGSRPAPTEDSVHLCRYPLHDAALEDELLEFGMDQALRVTTLGHAARKDSRLRVRQPLSRVVLVSREPGLKEAVESHRELLLEELNVKAIEFASDEQQFVSYSYKPNFREIGPRFGEQARDIAAWVNRSADEITRQLAEHEGQPVLVTVFDKFTDENGEEETITRTESLNWVELELSGERIVLDSRYFELQLHPHEGMVAQRERGLLLVLDTHLSDELRSEGLAREVVNRLQQKRKDLDLAYDARVRVAWAIEGSAADSPLAAAIAAHHSYIAGEVLASELVQVDYAMLSEGGALHGSSEGSEIDGEKLRYSISVV
ncbi:isoleucine--tRNA ligase [bacterium]|nr:isoleucine--tRNA ligase [bacterium]